MKKVLLTFSLCAFSVSYGMNQKLCATIASNDLQELETLLLDPNIDPNESNAINGNAPLIIAVSEGRLDIAHMLLNHTYIDVDKANLLGATALHVAVSRENKFLVQKLLQYNASMKEKNKHGKETAHAVAAQRGYHDIATLVNPDKQNNDTQVLQNNNTNETN